MQLDLSPEAMAVIERLMAKGGYRSAAQVVEEALLRLASANAADDAEAWLRDAVAEADASGPPAPMDLEDLRTFLKAGIRRSA